MKRLFVLLLFNLLPFSTTASTASSIIIDDAWVRASIGNMMHTAGYMHITNMDSIDHRLIGAEIVAPHALIGKVDLHQTVEDSGVFRMQLLEEGLLIPAGETQILQPKSTHLMLMELNQKLTPGMVIKIILRFANQTTHTVDFQVCKLHHKFSCAIQP
ncbi:MAG: copper chaperone PCu(A)C [Alphaproteobacteria bacterium]|nr:copper chaperone PCu(A)C [Alphaproteobacteria bacterium]